MEKVMDGYKLSPQQTRLWLLQQDEATYQSRGCVLFEGALSVARLQRALAEVIGRHDILRTVFRRRAGIRLPVQFALDAPSLAWCEYDLRGDELPGQKSRLEEIVSGEDATPFDFAHGAVCRATLLRLDNQRYVLRLCLPALCADASTLANIVAGLTEAYAGAENAGGDDAGSDEVVQYVQFAEWHNELLESGEDEEGFAFWSGRDADASALSSLKLGCERTPEPGAPFAPESVRLTFDAATVAKLDAAAAAAGATPELFLLACWQTLLWRLTGREEIVIGCEFAGRKFEELSAVCGLFARWLPVRASFASGQTFAEVLRQAEETVRESDAWQEYFNPETLTSPVATDASPVISYGFSYEALPAPVKLPGLAVSLLARHTCFEPFRMKLTCVRAGNALSAQLYYDASAFAAGDASRVARAFETLLASLALDPTASVCAAEILDGREKRRLLVELNRTSADFPSDQCLHQLFEAQAAATPHAPAVAFDGRTLTYAELNSRANRLAHYLRRRGVGRDTLVALCVERSLEMIVGLVGIMKAGGAYVPLDPEQPASRLAYQLADSRSPVLVTQRALVARLPEFAGEVICLDAADAPFASEDERDPAAVSVPSDCAYVIYTSGSTGIPKGVAVTHRGAVNYTTFIVRELGLDADALRPLRFATVSTISADLGNTAIFPALASGGCLHVIPYATATDGARFARYVSTNEIDVLKIVPSHLAALLAAAKEANILPRRFLITGGEALSFELLERIGKSPAGCRVINHYGPTETTIGSLTCTPDDERIDRAASATVPIGRPIANTEAFILDRNLQPVPVGVGGELLIGGAGLARGYVNNPEQTAEKFIEHPFSDEAGARLYRTGDLARFLPDGQIEFLGRVDHQVKIRGFRVEPGEVEARLQEHRQVLESIVVAREDEHGHKRLVAYIVAPQGTSPAVAELRDFLQQRTPDYMIPSAFVMLKALPLTANGKVDRAQLPDPATADAQQSYLAPRTAAETKLAEIWRQVLGVARVGVNDNFFELGGDSILSLQIIAKANGEGLRLTPKQLFDSPTVAALAAAVNDNAPAVSAEQGEVTGEVPLTPIQRWFFEHDFANFHHWNMSLVLEARRTVDPILLERALHALLRHHDALRLRFTRTEQGWSQACAPHTDAPLLEVISLSHLSVDAQATTFEREATRLQSTIDLTSGRLLRAAWFDYGAGEPGQLLLAAHHLCVDGISWRIIAEDLQRAYEDLEAGRAAHLPAKTTSWREWAGRLSERAASREVKREAAEWLDARRLDAAPLPIDFAGAPERNTVADARTISLALTADETEALLRDVPAAYQTQINDVLLAALADALHKWTNSPVCLIDMEGHGREHSDERLDVSRTVGWFTTHYPVALDVGRAFNGESLLKGVREQLARVPHNGIGYGLLRYLGGDDETTRKLRAHPEVSFNYLGQIAQANTDDALFALSRESGGAQRSPASARTHLLQVIAKVLDGRFELSVSYGARTHRRETVEKFAANFTASLRGLVAGSRSESPNGLAASDFPESGLTAKELERVLAQLATGEGAQLDGGAENLEDLYVLSPMQEGMLFHALSEPGEDAYFRQVSLRMRGRVRVSLFEEAWRRVVERHASLRTSFLPERQLQIVRRRVELPLEKHDWRDVPEAEREERFASLLRAEEERGLDVKRAPLMRLVLVRFAEDDYRLVWSYHHLVLEAWSRTLIYREVLAAYQALAEGREPGFERAPSYREYIAWLRQQDLTGAETFWRGALAGFNQPSPLTLDAEPPEAPAAVRLSGVSEWTLPADTSAALQKLARRHHLTLNTLVQGAWAILLSRYTGDADIVFGMVVAGRPVEISAVESIVGLFINTLPVRVSVSAEESLLPWLAALQAWQGEARQYEYSPLVRVLGWSELPRGATLFETVVNFGNFPSATEASNAVAGVEFCDARFVERGSYPLGLEVAPGTQMLLRAIYDARRFSMASIEAMLGRLGDVLQSFAANPETLLGEITLRQEPRPALESSSDLHDAEAEFAF